MRRAFIALVLALLFVFPTVALGAAASTPADGTHQVARNATNEYSLDELKRDGTHYSKPSARIAGQHVYWLTHEPADQPWTSEKQLLDTNTVQADKLYLNSIRVQPEPKRVDVHIAFWEQELKTTKEGTGPNATTTTTPVARNVTVVEQQVTLGKGWPTAGLNLPHHDRTVRMTIWIEGLGQEARWTLKHHSIATSDAIAIDSEGDYLWRAVKEFVAPTVIGAFLVGWLVKRAIDRAGVGPMWGYAPWIVLISIVTGFVVAGVFSSFAEIFVHAPFIVAAWTVAIIAAIMLETYEANVTSALFLQPMPEAARNVSGEHALDARKARKRTEKLLRTPDEDVAVVRGGLFPFLARVFGGTAHLRGIENLDTEIKFSNTDGNLFVVAPGKDSVIDYDPESFEWSQRPLYVAVATAAAGIGFSYLSGLAVGLAAAALTLGAGAVLFLTASDGYAAIEPAPAHLRSAWVTSMYLQEEAEEAETLQEQRNMYVREKARNEKDVQEALEDSDDTLVREMVVDDRTNGERDTPAGAGDSVEDAIEQTERDDREAVADGGDDADE